MSISHSRSSILQFIHNKEVSFEDKALALFDYHMIHNPMYQAFVSHLKYNEYSPETVREIPFFPISLFKDRQIKAGTWEEEKIFYSSGTTSQKRSQHYIREVDLYLKNAKHIWTSHFEEVSHYHFISLLPSYHANPSSSLISMVRDFMMQGRSQEERYHLDNFDVLKEELISLDKQNIPTVLFGVAFALLDFIDIHQITFVNTPLIIETGGMKKYRKEVTRFELHESLRRGFNGAHIISEYGMTECLSQMYCLDGQYFSPNDRMDIVIMDPTDPRHPIGLGQRGRICIIDLMNIDTMPFIATDDIGIKTSDGVEILGRMDASEVRGCNYLIA